MQEAYPLIVLVIGIAVIVGMITVLRINAFISLITSALIVSFLGPGEISVKVSRVAEAFGSATGNIGIVIALAVVIGKCMMDSGAADRIVQAFLNLLGVKRISIALMSSGFVLSIPVFFDTVFYLLVPLGRSAFKRTKAHYVQYIVAIAAGAAVTHSLVPPTPGPLLMAKNLDVEIGVMILMGFVIAIPTSIAGLLYGTWIDRRLDIPMRSIGGETSEPDPKQEMALPSLGISLLPILLPVLMVSLNTILSTLAKNAPESSPLWQWSALAAAIGNVNLAMLLSAAVAMLTLVKQRGLDRFQMARVVETSLMSGGMIILITAAGGAFGAMLKEAGIGQAISNIVSAGNSQALPGIALLFLGAFIASVMKIAQGSGTVAMITASAMMADIWTSVANPGIHPVYLATAIGSGSMIGTWMNDSGFWIVAKMGGFTENETFRTWTAMMVVTGLTGFVTTLILALLFPLTQ